MDKLTEADIMFFNSKGFDVTTADGLMRAIEWVKITDADNLMFGEPTGDPFDIQMGELRRPMLLKMCKNALDSIMKSGR